MGELISAIFKLGLPVAGFSWLMFSWLYREGRLDIKANRKTLDMEIKQMKKDAKSKNKRSDKDPGNSDSYVLNKWLWFGGGFYGVAAMWTFLVAEMQDFFNFVFGIPDTLGIFQGGIANVIGSFILNQLQNLATAFIWFTWWSEGTMWLWFLVAWLGYLVGIEIAKQYQGRPWKDWR